MSEAERTLRRIVIGAASFADAESALRIAERIVGPLVADLGGLMIEDTTVAALVGGPGRCIVATSGAVVVAPSARDFGLVVASQARAFETRLARLAEAHTLKWSFERRAGELVSGLFAAAREWDLLVVGQSQMHRHGGRVILLEPPAGAASPARMLAETVAGALATSVVALSSPAPTPEDVTTLLERISRASAAAVVADLTAGPLRGEADLRRLVEAARAPVFVIGADHESAPA